MGRALSIAREPRRGRRRHQPRRDSCRPRERHEVGAEYVARAVPRARERRGPDDDRVREPDDGDGEAQARGDDEDERERERHRHRGVAAREARQRGRAVDESRSLEHVLEDLRGDVGAEHEHPDTDRQARAAAEQGDDHQRAGGDHERRDVHGVERPADRVLHREVHGAAFERGGVDALAESRVDRHEVADHEQQHARHRDHDQRAAAGGLRGSRRGSRRGGHSLEGGGLPT